MGKIIDEETVRRIILSDYPDIVPTHPGWTDEDYERSIREDKEKVKGIKEWPRI